MTDDDIDLMRTPEEFADEIKRIRAELADARRELARYKTPNVDNIEVK